MKSFTDIITEAAAINFDDAELGLCVDKVKFSKTGIADYTLGITIDTDKGSGKMKGSNWAKFAKDLCKLIGDDVIKADITANPEVHCLIWFEITSEKKGYCVSYSGKKLYLPKM